MLSSSLNFGSSVADSSNQNTSTFWKDLGGILGNVGTDVLTNVTSNVLDKATGVNSSTAYTGTPPIIQNPNNSTPLGLIIGLVTGLVFLILKKKK